MLAYPPFVFDDATGRAVVRLTYLTPTLDGAAAGCSGQTVNVHYQAPR